VGLNIGVLGMEQFLGSLYSQVFDGVYVGAAGIITAIRVAFGVFVG